MALWIELHCDLRKEGGHPTDPLRPRCRTYENENPGIKCSNPIGAVRKALKSLHADARGQGWVPEGTRWVCPGCAGPGGPRARLRPPAPESPVVGDPWLAGIANR